MSSPRVIGVSRSTDHAFSKQPSETIHLLEGYGVQGDAHAGATVQHLSRVRRDPHQPNLRQVHLIHAELLEELAGRGFLVQPGELGENITTAGIDLLALPTGTVLRIGGAGDDERDEPGGIERDDAGGGAEVEITGLRNPCLQIDSFEPGLLAEVVGRGPDGAVVRKAGVMGVVRRSGPVRPGDPLHVVLPDGPHVPLRPV